MGCGCLLALATVISSRLALFLVWVFTPFVGRAFNHSFLLPLLGFIFLPFTTLVYALFYTPTGLSPFGWLFIIFAFVVDISSHSGGAYANRGRMRG